MAPQTELPITSNQPLPPEAQLELARITDNTKILRARSRVQATAITVVGIITAALVVGSVILTLQSKEVPDFFGTTISLLVTGLVSSMAFEAGVRSGGSTSSHSKETPGTKS